MSSYQSESKRPELTAVVAALDDPDCRTILEHLEEPMTAKEVASSCEIPLSTTYRKLDLLSESPMIEQQLRIKKTGAKVTLYRRDFEKICIHLDDSNNLEILGS